MYNRLESRMFKKCSDGEITEEEYERYSDMLQEFDSEQMREEYDFVFGDWTELGL
jgi:hypothetical protein